MSDPRGLNHMIYAMGQWYAAWATDEIREWFKSRGVTQAEIDALDEALQPVVKAFYVD